MYLQEINEKFLSVCNDERIYNDKNESEPWNCLKLYMNLMFYMGLLFYLGEKSKNLFPLSSLISLILHTFHTTFTKYCIISHNNNQFYVVCILYCRVGNWSFSPCKRILI